MSGPTPWRQWLSSPEVVVPIVFAVGAAILGLWLNSLSGSLDKLDDRVVGLDRKIDQRADVLAAEIRDVNRRIDIVLQQQTTHASQLGRLESEAAYSRSRLDKIAEKLQVAALEPTNIPTVQSPPVIPTLAFATAFSETQMKVLYSAIKDQPQPAFALDTVARAGEKLPMNTKTNKMPPIAEVISPLLTKYEYTVTKTGIALVDPTNETVAAVLPLPTSGINLQNLFQKN